MNIKLKQCSVRKWQRGDELSLVRHANNRKIWLNLRDLFPHPYTLNDAQSWIHVSTSQTPPTSYAIVVNDLAAGGLGFGLGQDINRKNAEIGFWLGEEFWGRGIMTEAVNAMSGFAFDYYDLIRIYAEVFEWNQASMRVLEKAGYTYEGRLKNSAVKDERIIDQVVYALVRE